MKTTARHFAVFKREFMRWLDLLAIDDWAIYFFHEEHAGSKAWCGVNLQGMIATIGLSKTWDTPLCDKAIRQSAFHEACELLLAPLTELAAGRFVQEHEIEIETHRIINRLRKFITGQQERT